MPNINKQIAIGHLGRDPEVSYTPNGMAICELSIGVTDKWKDKSGEQKEETEWVRCSIFGDLAELVGKEFKKGDAIEVEGKQKTRKWQDKSGQDRYSTELNAYYVARPIYPRKAVKQEKPSGGFASDMESDIPW